MLDSAFINLLDINADATLHPQRSFAQIARAAGLSYQQLIEVILKTCFFLCNSSVYRILHVKKIHEYK